jgi:hypothetical protein
MKIYSFGVEAGRVGGCGGMAWHGTDRKGQRERKGGEGGGWGGERKKASDVDEASEWKTSGRGKRMED